MELGKSTMHRSWRQSVPGVQISTSHGGIGEVVIRMTVVPQAHVATANLYFNGQAIQREMAIINTIVLVVVDGYHPIQLKLPELL